MEAIAQRLAPPCRLARRYDKVQRLAALNALFQDLQKCGAPGWHALNLLDVVDTVAHALGMWMSPGVRDEDWENASPNDGAACRAQCCRTWRC